jgi:hypothetical protein
MKYLKRFNENVNFYDHLKSGSLWNSISASVFENLEYWGQQDDITPFEDKLIDELVDEHIVSLGFVLNKVDKQKYEMEHRPGRMTDYRREYFFDTDIPFICDIKFLKYEDDLWLIECFLPADKTKRSTSSRMWICDSIEGVKDCIENNFG